MLIKPDLEIWKSIPGFECDYQISSCGRVRSLISNCIMSLGYTLNGYTQACLRISHRRKKSFLVHRLVMLAFVGPSDLTVNHKNGDKADNRLENLEYATRSENQRHALDVLGFQPKFGERHPHAKLTVEDVIAIRERAFSGETLLSLSAEFGRSTGGICDIVSGKAWRHAPGPIR